MVEAMEARMKRWRGRGGGIVLTDHMSGSEDVGYEIETRSAVADAGTGVCRDGD